MTESDVSTDIVLAKWSDRFLAWLIDFVIISIVSGVMIWTSIGPINMEMHTDMFWANTTNYVPTSLLFFAYWIILEYKMGQSVGKMALHLRVTDIHGNDPDFKGVAISSFGKAFLLPIDVVLGWIFTNNNRQRVFNKIGDTIVIKVKDNTDDITYKKD